MRISDIHHHTADSRSLYFLRKRKAATLDNTELLEALVPTQQQEQPHESVEMVTPIKKPDDIATFLEAHGCKNITSSLNLEPCSKKPWSGGGYGLTYRGAMENYYWINKDSKMRSRSSIGQLRLRGKTLPNPLPLVNKALALYQWKQDFASATQLCKEALALDDECGAAVDTLTRLSLQQGRVEEAIEMFTKHAKTGIPSATRVPEELSGYGRAVGCHGSGDAGAFLG
ncbi:unnamed protein product [Rhizoctonia solani]|uniref:Uncharacterized protein n=1 Tax=Rhizoctonia solani TaxID=456999 RepID=A0A8H3CIV2_9AGAM|nr:unnamed protein product [Rhizoctonia solani]